MAQYFKLPYWCNNGGDGSVGVNFAASIHDAEDAEEKDNEEYGEGWGEPSASSIALKVEDGKLFFLEGRYNDGTGKYIEEWTEVTG